MTNNKNKKKTYWKFVSFTQFLNGWHSILFIDKLNFDHLPSPLPPPPPPLPFFLSELSHICIQIEHFNFWDCFVSKPCIAFWNIEWRFFILFSTKQCRAYGIFFSFFFASNEIHQFYIFSKKWLMPLEVQMKIV